MIRLADGKDTPQVRGLWNYCFDDTPEFVDFYFEFCYLPENTLIAEEDGIVQASLQLLPYHIHLRGRQVPVSYIVGVATWPEFRGRGLVRRLLHYTGDVLKQREQYISILLPFQYDFYRKYGWEVCYDLLNYCQVEQKQNRISSNRIKKGFYSKVNSATDLDKLAKCYGQFMNPYHGYIMRNSKDWHKLIRDTELDNGFCYFYEEGESSLGYMLYTVNDKVLSIQELAYTTPEAKEALLQLALSHKGQVHRVIRKAPSWDTDYLTMVDSRGQLDKETFVMGRIHDPAKALTGIPYTGEAFTIQVVDGFYNANNTTFRVEEKNGQAFVTKAQQKADIIIEIQTLSQLLWGYLPPELAYSEGYVSIVTDKVFLSLCRLFPVKYNYMTEIY